MKGGNEANKHTQSSLIKPSVTYEETIDLQSSVLCLQNCHGVSVEVNYRRPYLPSVILLVV
jgi:hypothetical protein